MIIVAGKRRVQKRATVRDDWTKARRATFLKALRETCNVRHACRVTGRSTESAYRLRKRDAVFAASWAEALAIGYETLETELLSRALGYGGVENDVPGDTGGGVDVDGVDEGGDGAPATLGKPVFDPDLALKLLARNQAGARHGGGVKTGVVTTPMLEAMLLRKLDAVARRLARSETAAQIEGEAASGSDATVTS